MLSLFDAWGCSVIAFGRRLATARAAQSRRVHLSSLNPVAEDRTRISLSSNIVVALGSDRAAKVEAVRRCVERISRVDERWRGAEVISRAVETGVAAMPLSDSELARGARQRARAVREALLGEGVDAQLFVGLEGGFHSFELEGRWHTHLRGWACVTDGLREGLGVSPSISVPASIARRVTESGVELSQVIDEVAGERDVRSRQGAWGVLSRDLLTRAESFEAALIAAFAPFYNEKLYS
ncbi:MAG TPA: inosine/xanthosine triphosphatase [Pyrinomonadaceae bacterium]|nr:inosine/xanthosine triphosphatase [Pyrinomonadaceae bacterium]